MKKIKMEKSQLAREVAKQKTKLLEKRKETKEVTKKPMLKISDREAEEESRTSASFE